MAKVARASSFGNTVLKARQGEIHALIYCRVSSERQAREGHGLDSQKQLCVEYAKTKAHIVSEKGIFADTASGGGDYASVRPGQVDILKHIDGLPHRNFVVIVDDPSRLARDVKAHFSFREALRVRGVSIESPNFSFDESPEGEMFEGMTAVANQYQRKTNRRQVIQKMKARLERGYWPFARKKGYNIVKDPVHGKIGKPNKEGLKMLKPALEAFARGDLFRKIDFCRFLLEKGFWKGKYAERYLDQATAMLADPYHMGDIEYLPWEVERRKGHHQPLISKVVFENIKKRLNKPAATARVRKDITDDFPVRGLVNCVCNKHLTAAWSKGRSNRYGYYFCINRECALYRKSIPTKAVEAGFLQLLRETRLKDDVGKVIMPIFDRVWKEETTNLERQETDLIQRVKELNEKIQGITDLARKARTQQLRDVYEKQIEQASFELEREQGQSATGMDLFTPYRTALEKSTKLLKKPYSAWKNMTIEEQHELFFFVFDEKLIYDVKGGYRTAQIPTVARLFEDFVVSNSAYVEMGGIEPPCKEKHIHTSTGRRSFDCFEYRALRTNKAA